MKEEIIETIRETLYLKKDQISGSSKIEDVAMESMDLVELVAVLSNKYKISINPIELNEIKTVDDIVKYVIDHMGSITAKGLGESF
jgi:acyl carrier protein